MLYDPKWERKTETKADPFALGTLLSWLEQQPGDTLYTYSDAKDCLLCRYFRAHGFEVNGLIRGTFYQGSAFGRPTTYPDKFSEISNGGILQPQTYSDALSRARKLAA